MKHENHTRTIENLLRRSHENVERKFWLLIRIATNAGGTIKPASAAGNNRLKTYESSGTQRDFYVVGQDELLMMIMSQNIFLSPAVSWSEFLLCLKTVWTRKTV